LKGGTFIPRARKTYPFVPELQRLQQDEDWDERRSFVLGVVEVRLLHRCSVERAGKAREGDRGAYVDKMPRRMREHRGGGVQRTESTKVCTNTV